MWRIFIAGLVAVALLSTFGLIVGGLILIVLWRLGARAVRGTR